MKVGILHGKQFSLSSPVRVRHVPTLLGFDYGYQKASRSLKFFSEVLALAAYIAFYVLPKPNLLLR
jgi:hypothetical protein